jgi:plastocyanin
MKRLGVLSALLATSLALGGCGGGDDGGDGLASADDTSTDAGAGGGGDATGGSGSSDPDITLPDEVVPITGSPAEVTALDNSFDDVGISVPAGTTVRWTNRGRQDHDVIPVEDDGWGAEVEQFHPGDVYEYTFTEPGTYNYFCTIHGTAARGMVGVVVVE